MNLSLLLGVVTLLGFVIYFFFKNGNARSYLLYVAYLLPLMSQKLVPFDFGGLTVFDIISLSTLFLAPKAIFRQLDFLNYYFVLFVLFLAVLVISSIASDFPSRALFSLLTTVTPFIYARLLMLEIINDTGFIKELFGGLKFAGYTALAFILIQVAFGNGFTFYDTLNQNVTDSDSQRYPGYFMDSQINGIFLAMLSFVCLLNFKNIGKITSTQLILFTFIIAGVILAGSRSAIIGFGAALVFLIIFLRGDLRYYILRFAVLGATLLFFVSGTISTFKRFKQIDNSYDFRANIWEGAVDIFQDHPVLGIGMNNYQDYVKLHAQDQSLMLDNNEILYLDAPENGYLKLLTEWGIIAFSILMLIIITPVFRMFLHYFRGYDVRIATLFVAPILCCFLSFMSVYTLSDNRVVLVLTTALVLTIVSTEKQINFDESPATI